MAGKKKHMTVDVLQDRLAELLISGKITKDTPVCLFLDEFQFLSPLDANAELVAETGLIVDDLEDYVKSSGNELAKAKKKKEIARLRRLGGRVVCVGGFR